MPLLDGEVQEVWEKRTFFSTFDDRKSAYFTKPNRNHLVKAKDIAQLPHANVRGEGIINKCASEVQREGGSSLGSRGS